MKSCKWAIPGKYRGVSPSKALAVLKRIESRDGSATPKAIVEEARSPRCVLHKCFDWNDATAAEKYRIEQAGHILRHLVIVEKNGKVREYRAYVHVVQGKSRGFLSTVEAMGSPDARDYIIRSALAELESAERKLRRYRELAKACASVRSAIEAVRKTTVKRKTA